MLVFKEKHIKYGFTQDDSYVFTKGAHKGKSYTGPIMNYFKKVFAGEKMTHEVMKWDRLINANGEELAQIDYNKLKPKYEKDFNFPEDEPQLLTEKEIKEGKYKKYFVEYCGDICEVPDYKFKYYKKSSTPYHKAVRTVELDLGLSVYDIDSNLSAIAEGSKTIKELDTRIQPTAYMDVLEDLTTLSDYELEYQDGEPYAGDYHIHPMHGPMEGKFHTGVHNRLYWSRKERYTPKGLVP
tara:strand:+ start:11183 stop:11899 length:717 start_codon:yes stop_codon:yes gene_type:complete